MTQLFLITQREDLATSLDRYFRFRGGVDLKAIMPPTLPISVGRIAKLQWVPQSFKKICDAMENWADQNSPHPSGLLGAIGLIDVPELGSFDDLDPIDRTKGWSGVVAMLLLAFPEVHWVLLSPATEGPAGDKDLQGKFHFVRMNSFCEDLESILKFHDEGFVPLFDPLGLRHRIRQQIQKRPDARYVPLRESCATSIDEEETYSYFHSYVAYRFGFRSHVVTSYEMLSEIMSDAEQDQIKLSFEDVFLNFPDRRKGLSRIEARDNEFPGLKNIKDRIFVTSGHQRTKAEAETQKANKDYLKKLEEEGYYSEVLYKPEAGVFDIWARSGMKDRLNDGLAPFFYWPPALTEPEGRASGTHSAPGRLLAIAERLIRRANRILKNAESVSEAVYGATLALDAQEYLGHRTPTTSLEAVSLKHHLEVLAECMFYGVEYHLDTKSRFAEIETEMKSVGVWFRSETRQISQLNAEIGMLSDLVLTYRNFNQFSEEQSGLTQLRRVHRQLWFHRNKSWAWLAWPFRWYLDTLLASIPRFIIALIWWIFFFGFLYGMDPDSRLREDGPVQSNFVHGFEDALTAFFGMQPPHDLLLLAKVGPLLIWITMLIIVTGFVHLGIFVSHVYAMMSRR